MGVLEDWPRPRGLNFVALALASKTPGLGLGLGLDHVVLEHIPASDRIKPINCYLGTLEIIMTVVGRKLPVDKLLYKCVLRQLTVIKSARCCKTWPI